MTIAGATPPNMLRRLIKAIKRRPILTRTAWWVVKHFPALGRMVASRMIRQMPDSAPAAPVLIVPMLVWDAADPSTPTSKPLQRRLSRALKSMEGRPQ